MRTDERSLRVSSASDETLFAELYPRLWRFAAACSAPGLDADDLVQEAVVRTLRRHRLSELDAPAAYLRTAIVSIASNRRRAMWRRSQLLLRLDASSHHADSYPSELADLWQLPALDRALLYLVDVEGYSSREAGDLVGCTSEAVRHRVSRARTRLRSLMKEV